MDIGSVGYPHPTSHGSCVEPACRVLKKLKSPPSLKLVMVEAEQKYLSNHIYQSYVIRDESIFGFKVCRKSA